MSTAAAPKETNRPPLTTVEDLARDYGHVVTAIDALLAKAGDLPLVIEDEEDQSAVAELIPKLRTAHGRTEELREAEKKPYLDAGRTVDGWFGGQKTRVADMQAKLGARLDSFVRKKAEAERAKRETEEKRAREEAERQRQAAATAAAAKDTEAEAHARDRAAEAENEAREAAAAKAAKPAELVRTHTDAGNTVSAREVWTVTGIDTRKIDLNTLRPFLSDADIEQLVHRAVRAGARSLPGVRIEQVTKAIVR